MREREEWRLSMRAAPTKRQRSAGFPRCNRAASSEDAKARLRSPTPNPPDPPRDLPPVIPLPHFQTIAAHRAEQAIFVSAFLTSVVIALRVSVACMTLSAGELWQIILSISAAPTVLVGWIIAVRIRQTLTRIELRHQELVCSARIDGLTGLLNRPGFDAVAAEAFEETQRSGQPVSALLCDIDAFRGLNDRYGHEAGDRALKNLAEVLEESIGRRAAIIGRHGGDEFVILLPAVDLDEATMIAERLCEACEARALVHQHPPPSSPLALASGPKHRAHPSSERC
jgi:diguanylate cyclase (GGDEF)-like protein